MIHEAFTDLQHIGFEGKPVAPCLPRRRPLETQMDSQSTCQAKRTIPWPVEAGADRDDFLVWILNRAGLDPGLYRLEPLLRRIPACLRALKVQSPEDARQALHARPELLPAALRTLLIGVTSFFRDPAVFECLRTELLPELARRGGPLRIWSVACSSGAELYSVAVLLAEAGLLERSFLLGTDCRTDAIGQARAGLYSEELLREVKPDLRERYFRKQGRQWRLALPRQGEIAWKTANLGDRLEPGPWDLILFRNAAIYMASRAVQRIWGELAGALRPGGMLIVGKAERPAAADLRMIKTSVYRKVVVGGSSHD